MHSAELDDDRYGLRRKREQVLAASRLLPPRYAPRWEATFFELVHAALRRGGTVVDLGSGARPTVPLDQRPPGCQYVGVDISQAELDRAPAGSYSSAWAVDVSMSGASLPITADLILSWQVLEHVRSMGDALENMYRWLSPGGQVVALFSGSRALSSVLSRILPHGVRTIVMRRLYGSPPEDKFPTVFDCCRESLLRPLLSDNWASFTIYPRYHGATYLAFAPALMRTYLAYENYIARHEVGDLATHYVLHATK